MGRGDRRSRRGKIWRNSYGNSRPHHVKKANPKAKPASKKK